MSGSAEETGVIAMVIGGVAGGSDLFFTGGDLAGLFAVVDVDVVTAKGMADARGLGD